MSYKKNKEKIGTGWSQYKRFNYNKKNNLMDIIYYWCIIVMDTQKNKLIALKYENLKKSGHVYNTNYKTDICRELDISWQKRRIEI